ncbi:hypothetical protein [Sphingomonas sp.]|uniref:hypothetical protein n=1 Tax=Sphingomonas sp. TaxID=28214 RepID=UPI0035A8FBBE
MTKFRMPVLLAGATLVLQAVRVEAQGTGQKGADPAELTRALEARLDGLESEIASLRAELAQARADAAAAATATPQPAIPPSIPTPARTTEQRLTALEQDAALGIRVGATRFSIGGYLKLDALVSDFSGGDPPANALINDYYAPAQIPVGGIGEGAELTTSVRETRIVLRSETPLAGQTLTGLFEVDFLDTPLIGNQRVSNSFVPRVRRAFITWNDFTFGQDWSTFQNAAALPERIDFIGPTEGTVFERQPLIRWRNDEFSIALENPETTITVGTASFEADDDVTPDLVLRYDHRLPHGSLTLAAIGRYLSVKDLVVSNPGSVTTINGEAFGWGVSASGVYDFGPNRLSWMGNVGEGIGRYLGINIRDDVIATATGKIDAPLVYSGFIALRRSLSPRWRLIGTGSAYHSTTPEDAAQSLTATVWSGNLDLIYNPLPHLTLGIGFRYASRELANGAEGSLRRVQLSVRYDY